MAAPPKMPYFDDLAQRLQVRRAAPGAEPADPMLAAFGRHVHWGMYEDPGAADDSVAGLSAAQEALTRYVCDAGGVIGAGARVLDVGCGYGGTIAHLNDRLDGVCLVGVNVDPRQVERARALVKARPGNRIEFLQGDACALPDAIAAGSCTDVLCVEAEFHFPSRARFLAEVSRVMVPGGRLRLCTFMPNGKRLLRTLGYMAKHREEIKRFYGEANPWALTRGMYVWLARRKGLRLVADHDITAKTLPTYAVVSRLVREAGIEGAEGATQRLEVLAREGCVEYRVLSFVKG
jgi:SAM-dependent methyltransferase